MLSSFSLQQHSHVFLQMASAFSEQSNLKEGTEYCVRIVQILKL